jgi:hypothetical protein
MILKSLTCPHAGQESVYEKIKMQNCGIAKARILIEFGKIVI